MHLPNLGQSKLNLQLSAPSEKSVYRINRSFSSSFFWSRISHYGIHAIKFQQHLFEDNHSYRSSTTAGGFVGGCSGGGGEVEEIRFTMLENPSADLSAAAAVKRYAPPNQRHRSLGRRKSGGDRLERANSYSNDGSLGATKSAPIEDHVDSTFNNRSNESGRAKLIPLHGCCSSEAAQLLSNRWSAAMNAHNSLPEDSDERPVLYSRKNASPWGRAFLPHMMMQQTGGGTSAGLQRDFLSELRQAMHNANSGANV